MENLETSRLVLRKILMDDLEQIYENWTFKYNNQ
mgnify:FL=1